MTEKKRLRWKKKPRETGLRAVGANSRRSSRYHDGTEEYASVCPNGGNWAQPFQGWFFTARISKDFINSLPKMWQDEADAKKAAETWVKERMK